MRNFKTIKETEKAVMLEMTIELTYTEKSVKRTFWAPKSMLNVEWFIDKKVAEVMAEFSGQGAVNEDDFANEYGIEALPDLV